MCTRICYSDSGVRLVLIAPVNRVDDLPNEKTHKLSRNLRPREMEDESARGRWLGDGYKKGISFHIIIISSETNHK